MLHIVKTINNSFDAFKVFDFLRYFLFLLGLVAGLVGTYRHRS